MPVTKSSPYRGVTLFRPTGKWRAQISAQSRTVSLGDHDTEEEAAQAFDRAAINRSGRSANTNFPMAIYEAEITELTGLSQEELIATLRNRARKVTAQTSSFRGVSLLKQTGKWHAQINVGGKQVHLGYYLNEQVAARAYDRAAINRCAKEGIVIATNFSIEDYRKEVQVLSAVSQEELVIALADEERRKGVMDMLAGGFTIEGARQIFGPSFLQNSGAKQSQPKAPKSNRELMALHRGAGIDKSAVKPSSRKQRGREASPQAAAAPALPSQASIFAAPAVQSSLPDDKDASHSQGKQATAVESASVVKAGPAATVADGGHSQLDHLAASKTAVKPAAAPASTASKLRSGRTSAKTMNVSASPVAAPAGSKRSAPMTDQPHLPARENMASKPKKQRTSVTDVSTASKPATDGTQSGILPDGASKQAPQSKTGLRVKLIQRKQGADLTAPPVTASAASAPSAPPEAVKQKHPDVKQPKHRAQATFQQTKNHPTAHSVSSPPAIDASNAEHAQPDMSGNDAAASGDVATAPGKPAATGDGADASAVSRIRLYTQQRARRGIARRALPSLAEAYQQLHETQEDQPAASADGQKTSSSDAAAASDSGEDPCEGSPAASEGDAATPGEAATASGDLAGASVVSQPKPIDHRSVLSRQRRLGLPTMAEAYQRLDERQNLSAATSDASDRDAVASEDDAAASGDDAAASRDCAAASRDHAAASGDDAAALGNHAAASAQDALGSLESDSEALPEAPRGRGSRPIPPGSRKRRGITRADAYNWLQAAATAARAASDTSSEEDVQQDTSSGKPQHTSDAFEALATGSVPQDQQDHGSVSPTAGQTSPTAAASTDPTTTTAVAPNAELPGPDAQKVASKAAVGQGSAVRASASVPPQQVKPDTPPQHTDVSGSGHSSVGVADPAVHGDKATAVGKVPNMPLASLPMANTDQPEHAALGLVGLLSMPDHEVDTVSSPSAAKLENHHSTADTGADTGQPADVLNNAVLKAPASRANTAAAAPITPETSPLAQQAEPLTQQSHTGNASPPGTAAPGQQISSSAPMPAQSFHATVSCPTTQLTNLLKGYAAPTTMPSEMTFPHAGFAQQLAPGSALQKQRLAMTDPSLHMAAASTNTCAANGNSSPATHASPSFRMSLTKQQVEGMNFPAAVGNASPALRTQTPSTSASLQTAVLGQTQAANQTPTQNAAHGDVALPGQQTGSDAFKLLNAQATAYQASQGVPGLQSTGSPSAASGQPFKAGSSPASAAWPHAPPYPPQPGMPAFSAQQPFSLPPGAQVTVPKLHPQPTKQLPQLKLDPNLQARQMLARSSAMTNAHAIVPGMASIPNPAMPRTGTAWQVGLAAGLAATANMRPPSTSSHTHQAAATAAAARAAAAFQASRALSMAKGYSQPLQQGLASTATLGLSSPQAGNTLAGPDRIPGGYTAQTNAFANRPLITSGSGYTAASHVQSSTAGSGTAATASNISATSPRANLVGTTSAGPAAAATAAALATAQQKYRALQGTTTYPATAHQGMHHSGRMGSLPGQAAAYGRPGGPQTGALAPTGQNAPGQAAHQTAMQYMPQSSQAYVAQPQAPYGSIAHPAYGAHAQQGYAQQPSAYVSTLQLSSAMPSQAQHSSSAAYESPAQMPFSTSVGLQYQYPGQQQQHLPYAQRQPPYPTAAQPYATAAPPSAPLRPLLLVEQFTFSKLAPQPKNAIDIISDDAVLPTFPLKKKKLKKRKYAGLDAFAAEVYRHKELAQEARRNVLQCQVVKKGPLGRPPKMEALPKAASASSPTPKAKAKEVKSHKAKNATTNKNVATTKAQKVKAAGKITKRSPRVVFGGPGKHKQANEPAPLKRFETMRPREGHMSSGLDQLLGALGEEFEAFEAEERINRDAGEESGTDRQGPSGRGQGKGKAALGRGYSAKRGRDIKVAPVGRAATPAGNRGRGKVKGHKEAPGRGGKGRKREPSSSPDRGPPRQNRRKLLAVQRGQ